MRLPRYICTRFLVYFPRVTASNPVKLISSSVSAFHYRVYSHGTREHASERTREATESYSPSHFQSSIISRIDEFCYSRQSFSLLSPFFRPSPPSLSAPFLRSVTRALPSNSLNSRERRDRKGARGTKGDGRNAPCVGLCA